MLGVGWEDGIMGALGLRTCTGFRVRIRKCKNKRVGDGACFTRKRKKLRY